MFGKARTTAQIAEEIRSAERRLAEAERAAADLEKSHQERVGAALADGDDGGDVAGAAGEIAGARLKADALRVALGRLHTRLREQIVTEDRQARAQAEKTIAECDREVARLLSDAAKPAAELVKLFAAMLGASRAYGAALALNDLRANRFRRPTEAEFRALVESGDAFSCALVAAAKSAESGPDNGARRQAAQAVLARQLDVERRVREFLPRPPIELPPAQPRTPEPEEAHLPVWRIEPSLKDPHDDTVKIG